ncbi:MAG: ABC transporter permease [Pseudomonadaceae bacterium]|nr:ABC transporter permease [Pseudomonadaceae bacterium]
MLDTLLIHVGLPKTASTAIQIRCRELHQSGHIQFTPSRDKGIVQSRLFYEAVKRHASSEDKESLRQFLTNNDARYLVVSDELLSRVETLSESNLIDQILPLLGNRKVEVVVVLRDNTPWLESLICQSVKTGQFDFDDFDASRTTHINGYSLDQQAVVRFYENIAYLLAGRGQFRVRTLQYSDEIVGEFAKLLGQTAETPASIDSRHNASTSAYEALEEYFDLKGIPSNLLPEDRTLTFLDEHICTTLASHGADGGISSTTVKNARTRVNHKKNTTETRRSKGYIEYMKNAVDVKPDRIYSAESETGMKPFALDMFYGAKSWRVWTSFAFEEISNKYRRTAFGMAWIGISFAIFVAAISAVFGHFSSMSAESFLVYASFGLAAFLFVSNSITDGCNVFSGNRAWILGSSLPYSVYVYKSVLKNLITLAIQLTLCFALLAWLRYPVADSVWLILPGIALLILNSIWIHYLIGIVSSRFHDITQLVLALTRLLFFTTPVLWVYEESTGLRRIIADWNPLTHFVEILRSPMLGESHLDGHWIIVAVMTIVGCVATILVGAYMRKRIGVWI